MELKVKRKQQQKCADTANDEAMGETVRRLGTIIQKHFLCPIRSQNPLEFFRNSSVTVGTEGLFRPYLKIFATPFLPTRLTAPGSPRMLSCRTSGGKGYIQSIHAHRCCKQELLSAQSPPSPGDDQKSAYTGSSPEICSVSPPAHLMGIVRCCRCFRQIIKSHSPLKSVPSLLAP